MSTPTQLDRIEAILVAVQATQAAIQAKLQKLDLQNQQQTGLLQALTAGDQLIMASLADLAAQIDAATTAIASKLSDESAKLDTEGAAITNVAAVVADLRKQIADGVAPQAVIDQLASVGTRLTAAASAIDASTTAIDAHAAQLVQIAADPNNPVPAPVPPPAAA